MGLRKVNRLPSPLSDPHAASELEPKAAAVAAKAERLRKDLRLRERE
jgi:hypothetical protein